MFTQAPQVGEEAASLMGEVGPRQDNRDCWCRLPRQLPQRCHETGALGLLFGNHGPAEAASGLAEAVWGCLRVPESSGLQA